MSLAYVDIEEYEHWLDGLENTLDVSILESFDRKLNVFRHVSDKRHIPCSVDTQHMILSRTYDDLLFRRTIVELDHALHSEISTLLYTRQSGRHSILGILPAHGSTYIMDGDFQSMMQHSVPKMAQGICQRVQSMTKNTTCDSGGRLSLTFRYLGRIQPRVPASTCPIIWSRRENGQFCALRYVRHLQLSHSDSFSEVYNECKNYFAPDVTKWGNNIYDNGGRLYATFSDPNLPSYRYGGHKKKTVRWTPYLQRLLRRICYRTGILFNWLHVVYYPNGDSGLGWHRDNETSIAKGSAIAGITLYANNAMPRPIEFQVYTPPTTKRNKQAMSEKTVKMAG